MSTTLVPNVGIPNSNHETPLYDLEKYGILFDAQQEIDTLPSLQDQRERARSITAEYNKAYPLDAHTTTIHAQSAIIHENGRHSSISPEALTVVGSLLRTAFHEDANSSVQLTLEMEAENYYTEPKPAYPMHRFARICINVRDAIQIQTK